MLSECDGSTRGRASQQPAGPDVIPVDDPPMTHSSATTISLIIPAYNEAHHIDSTLAKVLGYLRSAGDVKEIIVVDDGSTDATAELVQAKIPTYDAANLFLRVLRLEHNQGKGAAIRHGILHASGDIAVFTDADLSSPIEALHELAAPIRREECDIVVASRAVDRSMVEVRQSRFRETAGMIFNLVVRTLTGLPIKDTQCGFKAFRREPVTPLFAIQRIGAFAFDVEILYLARKHHLRIREIPMPWQHVEHTSVRMLRDSWRMFRDVFRIRLYDLLGHYDRELEKQRETADEHG